MAGLFDASRDNDLNRLQIQDLRIDGGSVDLAFRRHPRDVGMNLEKKSGDIQVVMVG